MKKTLIALAALAVVGAASAQSSVTLYGRLDLGTSYNKTTVGTTTTKTTELAGAQGKRTGGRLGVRGSEDLGGGLKANFNVETRVNPDLAGTTFGATRTAILQLAGAFGSATIGTYLNTIDDLRGYGAATAGVAGGDFLGAMHDNGNRGLGGRSENAIGYRSPSFGGLDFRIGTTHQKTDTSVAGGSTVNKTTGYIAGAGYNNGPVSALFAIGQGKAKSPAVAVVAAVPGNAGTAAAAAVDAKVNDWGFAVSYNLGVAVPYFQYENSKLTSAGATAFKTRSWELGSKFPMGAFTPYVTVSSGKITTGAGVDTKARAFQVGTTYDLSKRTYVYAAVGSDKNVNVVNAVGAADTKRNGYALGLVHNF